MSTRGVIARKTGSGFEGRYHHWDSYPSGLGQALYTLYNGHFNKDIPTMMRTLVDEHPAGWSTINDADFTLVPGFVEYGSAESNRPQCYCHGDRHEQHNMLITEQGDTCGTEYAYAIDERTCMMSCYGYRYSAKQWELFAEIDLNGPSPEWDHLSARI